MSTVYCIFCGLAILVNVGNVFGAGTEVSGPVASANVFQFPVSIPEPATILFLVLGCLPIFALRKRGQK
jgi:hypothetical protein